MDHNEWINDEVRVEIEDLQRDHGFEEDEAVAFWHLQQAGKRLNALWRADLRKEMDRYEGRDDREGQTAQRWKRNKGRAQKHGHR